jgi:tetratricopeptide (TPR) repeat protein
VSNRTTDRKRVVMTCDRVVRDEIIEQYVTGGLGAEDREAFEQHYFDCERCSEALDVHLRIQSELDQPSSSGVPTTERRRRPVWVALALAAAAIVAVALWWPHRVPQPEPAVADGAVQPGPAGATSPVVTLAELAAVEPPAYRPVTLRSPGDTATRRFREAMESYARGDFAGAIPGLQAAAALDARQPSIQFFLGACYLLTDDIDDAVRTLQVSVALGESAYLEEAQFYLAKAFLHRGDVEAARTALRATVELRGDREQEAQRLLQQIDKLPGPATPGG